MRAAKSSPRDEARRRLRDEVGTIHKDAPERVALVYPSPYHVGMSSLGFQTIYREINARRQSVAERAFLPDDVGAFKQSRTPLFTYESERPVADHRVIALSVAFELELAGVVQTLELAGLPPLAEDRTERHPLVLGGGPLTFSNPLPLAPYVDAILMGEADDAIHSALDAIFSAPTKHEALAILAREVPSAYVPSLHGDELATMGKSDRLPAYAQIRTPHTELRDMFLIEPERGCSRQCQYCVMRRSTNGGMRLVSKEQVLALIPESAKRVGLVGAAVTDHPEIVEIVETLAEQGREVGISSLRADRLRDRFAAALRKAGYRTLTTASDGSSQRMRDLMQRKTNEMHLERAAVLARTHGFDRMKLYMMIGLPGEEDRDIEECIELTTRLSTIIPLSLGIAPFVAKRNTPLDGHAFAGQPLVEARLERLRRGTKGRVDVRSTSARWAEIEYVLAQGGRAEGRAVLDAVHAGGKYRDYVRAFAALPASRPKRALRIVA